MMKHLTTLNLILSMLLVNSLWSCQELPILIGGGSTGGTGDSTDFFDPYRYNYPFSLEDEGAKFYKNVPYDNSEMTTLDFFKASGEEESPLLISIHGGGFVSGDKSDGYSESFFQNLTNSMLNHNISVVSVNYRLVERSGDEEGLIKRLSDIKRALQFLRYYEAEWNLDEDKVVLMGSSAGAGSSLWLGLKDDMADVSNDDPILNESTRVSGIVATSTQGTYDIYLWTDIFAEYDYTYQDIEDIISEDIIMSYYGVSEYEELQSEEVSMYRHEMDFASDISFDDPIIYVANSTVDYKKPSGLRKSSELLHHPLHAKYLKDKCDAIGLESHFNIPSMSINTTEGMNIEGFVMSVLLEE